MTDVTQPILMQTPTPTQGILKTNSDNITTDNIRPGPSLNRRVIHEGKNNEPMSQIEARATLWTSLS